MALLKAVDDSGSTKVVQARDKAKPKANAWARLHDLCFGGGQQGRGCLSSFGIAPVNKPTQLKAKVLAIWEECHKCQCILVADITNIVWCQCKEYQDARDDDEKNRKKGKQDQTKLQAEMKTYQRGLGALPPGAKGTQGRGHMKHSTNTHFAEPASFAYANTENKEKTPLKKTATAESIVSSLTNSGSTTKTSRKSYGSRNSTVVHVDALEQLSLVSQHFENTAAQLGFGGSLGTSSTASSRL
jgi:hypothetical protein